MLTPLHDLNELNVPLRSAMWHIFDSEVDPYKCDKFAILIVIQWNKSLLNDDAHEPLYAWFRFKFIVEVG